ncbi:uncharacterized protein LOC112172864 [Rosa chinensis]|nr:uncharacterized protein LOC112172864 [Rosa chinensis]
MDVHPCLLVVSFTRTSDSSAQGIKTHSFILLLWYNGAEGLHPKVTEFVRDKDCVVCGPGVLIELDTSVTLQKGIPEQQGDKTCGFWIMHYMKDIVEDKNQEWSAKINMLMYFSSSKWLTFQLILTFIFSIVAVGQKGKQHVHTK